MNDFFSGLFPENERARNSLSETSRSLFCLVNQDNTRPLESQWDKVEKLHYSFSLPNSTSILTVQKSKRGKCIALDYTRYLSGAAVFHAPENRTFGFSIPTIRILRGTK